MNISKVLFLLVLASCGKIMLPQDSSIGTYNSLESKAILSDSNQYEFIKKICDSVALKSVTIDALVNSTYTFSGTAKSCTESTFTALPDAAVSLVNQSGSYKLVEGQNQFYFADFETSTSGVLSQICATLPNLASPLTIGSSLLYYTTSDISSSDCPGAAFEQCIKIETAVPVTVDKVQKARVHTRDWIRVNLRQPRQGFFTYKKRISEASCVENTFFGRTATLK